MHIPKQLGVKKPVFSYINKLTINGVIYSHTGYSYMHQIVVEITDLKVGNLFRLMIMFMTAMMSKTKFVV